MVTDETRHLRGLLDGLIIYLLVTNGIGVVFLMIYFGNRLVNLFGGK